MPENLESLLHLLYLLLHLHLFSGQRLVGLHADASKQEEERLDAKSGHDLDLSPASKIFQGPRSSQTTLWPARFSLPEEHPDFHPITDLVFKDIHLGNRVVVIEWETSSTPYFFKVCFYIYYLLFSLSCLSLVWVFDTLISANLYPWAVEQVSTRC